MYFSLFWRLDIQEQGTDRFSVQWGPSSWSINGISSLSPHRVEGARHWSVCVCAQSRPTLCKPMDCSPPGPSVHGIFQAKIREWLAISSFMRSSQLKDQAHISLVSCITGNSLPSKPQWTKNCDFWIKRKKYVEMMPHTSSRIYLSQMRCYYHER